MIRCHPSGTCLLHFSDYINEEVDIKTIDWCKYIFDALFVCKVDLKKDNSVFYVGPHPFLIVSFFL